MQAAPSFVSLVAIAIVLAGCTSPTSPSPLEASGGAAAEQPASPSAAPRAPTPPPAPASPPSPAAPVGTLRVHYVDVGQGDGVVWELPGGGFVVYDCGDAASSAAANPVVQRLRGLGLQAGGTIHALVASHGHLDHVGGCEEVLQEYRVLHLYEAWYDGTDAPQSYARFREQLKAEGGTIHVLAATPALDGEVPFRAGDVVDLPEAARAAGVRAEVLWPPAWQDDDWRGIAESSIAVRLSLGDVDFCFQGDIEAAQERALARGFAGKDCEVYLMGHHGSREASSAEWLAAMDPEVAVVSFGTNSYGHPTSEALCRVQQAGAKVYATLRLGTIAISAAGTPIQVVPDRQETADYCAPGGSYWDATPPPSPTPSAAPAPSSPSPSPSPGPAPEPAGAALRITATQFDAPGSDQDANLVNEWVQLTNQGQEATDLGGWTLSDTAGHLYRFPAGFTLGAGASVKVRTGVGTNTDTDLYWGRGVAVWNNDGDTAYLKDASGRLVDSRAG